MSADLEAKVAALGPAGRRWLDQLDEVARDLAGAWGLTLETTLGSGSSGVVVGVRSDDGTPLALKLSMPDGLVGNTTFEAEVRALQAGAGAFVDVHRVDLERRALLLARLGRPLEALGRPLEEQVEILAETLARTWRPVPPDLALPSGDDKAEALADWIHRLWEELGRPCSHAAVDQALASCAERQREIAALGTGRLVLVHGDGHPANVLEQGPGDATSFRLIDPEGLRSEPAHDLGIAARDWNDHALATADPAATVRGWCRRLGDVAGVDGAAVLAWATIERMSTGLFLVQLGLDAGRDFLAVSDLLAAA